MRAASSNRRWPLLALLLGAAALVFAPAAEAQTPRPSPYDSQVATLAAGLKDAAAPQAAVLLQRIYDLRDYVDDPSQIAQAIAQVAADPARHQLVRDEALRLLALIDLHENRLQAARAKWAQLGFVRQWAVVGPFSTTSGQQGPEAGFHADRNFADGNVKRRWRVIADYSPGAWLDLADFLSQAAPAAAFAGTSVFCEKARAVALRFASDSGVTLYVNGKQVFHRASGGRIGFDQEAVAVELHAGWNAILLKLYRAEPTRWRFGLRITGLTGGGLLLTASATEPGHGTPAPTVLRSFDDLVTMAQRAAEAEPSPANLELLGRIERDHGRGNWREHFEAAARRQPTATRWLLVERSCAEPACKFSALNAALKAEPTNANATLALADYYFAHEHLEKARDLLRAAIAHEPGNFVLRKRLSDVFFSAGLNSQVLEECRRLATEFPKPLWMRRELASRFLDFGLLDEAQALLEAALPINWDASEERALLLRIYERRNDAARLRKMYAQAAQLSPNDPLPLARLAQISAGASDFPVAEAYMRAALERAPDSNALHRQFAELLLSAGKTVDARQELAHALEQNPLGGARRRLQALGSEHEADPDAGFLADVPQLAADVHHGPPPANANAIALADVRVERVSVNGLSSVRVQQAFYVANQQGARELGKRSVQYTPDSQQLEILHARFYKRDGRILEAEDGGEDAIAEPGAAMYYDVRAHALCFPGLEAGDVVELDYRVSPSEHANPYGDYFADLVIFGAAQPEKLKRFVLITPEQRQFHVLEERMPAPAAVSTANGQRTYVWEARDLPPLSNEPRAPAITELAPYVNVSTFNSWEDLGRWYAQLVRPQFALDSALREVLERLLEGRRSELDKVRAIHEFVLRNTHYVALEFGIYGYKPYPVSQVYARRFGDCKDKASLMIALLRAAGIEADIALVRTRRLGDISPRAASISVFNHAVAYLPRYDLWLDGTAEYAGSRELPLEDQGAMALTVGADGHAQLRRIPVTTAAQNYTRRTVQAQILPHGSIQFSGSAYSRGEDAPGLRREYEVAERQRNAFRDRLAEIFPSVHLEDVQVDGANDLEHDITVNFRGTLDTFAGRKSLSLSASWMPRAYIQNLAPLASRTQPLLLPAPWTTEEELHFALPPGAQVEAMPGNTTLETPFGSATLQFEQRGREVVVRTSVQFRQLRIAARDYAGFRDFCDQVERAFRGEVKIRL